MPKRRLAAALVTLPASVPAAARVAPPPDAATTVSAAPERASTFARAELVSLQTVNGLVAGIDLCVITECDSARSTVGFLMLGAGVGFGASLLATSDGVTPGTTALVNSGSVYGALDGALLAVTIDAEGESELAAAILAGQVIGTGIGALLASRLEPTGGQVSLATTVGSWAGGAALLVNGIAGTESEEVVAGSVLAAMNLGLVGGAFLADGMTISRGRALLINTGGALGVLVGAGVDVLIQGDDPSRAGITTSMLVGAAAGLALTTYLTRHWDAPAIPAQLSVLPARGGAIGSLSLTW